MGKEENKLFFCICSASQSTTFILLGTQSREDFFQNSTMKTALLAPMFVTSQQLPDAIAQFTNKTVSSLSPRLKNPNKFDSQPKLFFLHSDDDM